MHKRGSGLVTEVIASVLSPPAVPDRIPSGKRVASGKRLPSGDKRKEILPNDKDLRRSRNEKANLLD
jgi:hypothetical protein